MNRLTSWTMIATCAVVAVAGLSVSPAKAQDVREDRQDIRQDTRDVRSDKQDIGKDTQGIQQDRAALRGARQQLRDAYKSGDPNAVKAARENLRKTRSSLRTGLKDRRRADLRDLHHDRQDRRADVGDLHRDKLDRRADERDVHGDRRDLRRDFAARPARPQ